MRRADYLERTRRRGVNPLLYWIVRGVLQPFFHLYFRMARIGREHMPQEGPAIIAANHRSFLDPFVIGTLVRRPVYFVAKTELFRKPLIAWFLNSLGAFPIDRGSGDGDAMAAAREILQRGDVVVIFPEGTRIRPGALGRPRRGVGRLALETGAPVVPVAVIGTEAIRKGWRIRPHKVRLRVGSPLRFPTVADPSPDLARAVTERIWPCVALQWEWLGGTAPVRHATVVGSGAAGLTLAVALERAGAQVTRVAPAAPPPPELATADLVVFAGPAAELPRALDAVAAAVPRRAGVLVAARGLTPDGRTPAELVGARCAARAVAVLGGPLGAGEALDQGASVVVAARDRGFARQLGDLLRAAGLDAAETTDVVGVELAGAGAIAAALAAALATRHGVGAAGAAAGQVFAEVGALARRRGADGVTLAGLAGSGDLVGALLAAPHQREPAGTETISLLAAQLREAGIDAPATEALAALVDGRMAPESWADRISRPTRPAAKVA